LSTIHLVHWTLFKSASKQEDDVEILRDLLK
jgi:hypothetical protein